MATPEITLYTNHGCPWAHRAHIALAELQLPFKEEIIDLTTPRTAEYLAINPRGLVPTLVYDGQVIAESGIVAQFLADAYPEKAPLVPATASAGGRAAADAALFRARVNFFVDTWFSKVNGSLFKLFSVTDEEEIARLAAAQVDAIVKEIEPLLQDAKPFFGGKEALTLAEVLTGSFIIRHWASVDKGLLPESWRTSLAERAPKFSAWAEAVVKHPSVNGIFDPDVWVGGVNKRRAAARAQ